MTIRDALKEKLEDRIFERQRNFLTAWLEVAGQEPSKSIAPDLCSKVVFRACTALSFARRDDKGGADRHAKAAGQELQRVLHAIAHMRALRDYYGETLARVDPEFTGHTEEEVEALADKVAWCNREGKVLTEEARILRIKSNPTVHVSNQKGGTKEGGREKRIFMQRLRSELTVPLFGHPYIELVMCLTDIAYPGKEPTSVDDVKNAWKKMPKR
jgi:hypothetical protein